MINRDYYNGFEGEPELILFNEEQRFVMWIGYFESILDSLLKIDIAQEGILKEYTEHEGWYDDSPWKIPDKSLTIAQLKYFDTNLVNQSENIKSVLPELVQEIIEFLGSSDEDVWIEYD